MQILFFPGFQNLPNRSIGFNLEDAKQILEDLARFNALSIAFKQKKSDMFEKNIQPWCSTFKFPEKMFSKVLKIIRAIIEKDPECCHVADKATSFIGKEITPPREPFAALVNVDLWVHNTMQLRKQEKISKNVFVDFQLLNYRSCVSDVFFFIWTSVQKPVLEQYLDVLFEHYHEKLVNTLKLYGIDTSMFDYSKFLDEIRIESDFEFGHSIIFAFLLKLKEEIESQNIETIEINSDLVTPKVNQFILYMVRECDKRGWL